MMQSIGAKSQEPFDLLDNVDSASALVFSRSDEQPSLSSTSVVEATGFGHSGKNNGSQTFSGLMVLQKARMRDSLLLELKASSRSRASMMAGYGLTVSYLPRTF